jgi:hypothetical protein
MAKQTRQVQVAAGPKPKKVVLPQGDPASIAAALQRLSRARRA